MDRPSGAAASRLAMPSVPRNPALTRSMDELMDRPSGAAASRLAMPSVPRGSVMTRSMEELMDRPSGAAASRLAMPSVPSTNNATRSMDGLDGPMNRPSGASGRNPFAEGEGAGSSLHQGLPY